MQLLTAIKISSALIGTGLVFAGFIALWFTALEWAEEKKWYGFAVLFVMVFVALTTVIWLIGKFFGGPSELR